MRDADPDADADTDGRGSITSRVASSSTSSNARATAGCTGAAGRPVGGDDALRIDSRAVDVERLGTHAARRRVDDEARPQRADLHDVAGLERRARWRGRR